MLSVLLDPILPVFAIMFIGFFAGRFGKVTDDEARILNKFAMTVLLPIFIFRAVALAPITDFNLAALALYATAQAVLYTLGFLIARKVYCLGVSESLLLGFCGVFANNAYYVLPIAKLLYGDSGTLPVASIVIMDAILVFGGTMVALEARKGRDAGAGLALVAARIAKLPLIWALALGLVVSAGSLALPGPIDTFTAFVGNAASPIALFAMGVILSATPLNPNLWSSPPPRSKPSSSPQQSRSCSTHSCLPPTRYRSSFWQVRAPQALWPFRWRSFILCAQTRSCR